MIDTCSFQRNTKVCAFQLCYHHLSVLPEIQYRPFDKRFPLFARCRKSAKIADKMAGNEKLECDQEISGLTVYRKCASHHLRHLIHVDAILKARALRRFLKNKM